MPVIELEGIQLDVDEDGFIQDPATWNEEMATAIAKTEEGSRGRGQVITDSLPISTRLLGEYYTLSKKSRTFNGELW